MITPLKYRFLIWLVILLLAINAATVASLFYHTHKKSVAAEENQTSKPEESSERGTQFFGEQLNLNPDQILQFREIHREYNRSANRIIREMEFYRIQMVNEMGKPDTDREQIRQNNQEFGKLHEDLKNITADYYLKMKDLCNEEQQQRLYEIFSDMVKTEGQQPGLQGRRRGRAWNP